MISSKQNEPIELLAAATGRTSHENLHVRTVAVQEIAGLCETYYSIIGDKAIQVLLDLLSGGADVGVRKECLHAFEDLAPALNNNHHLRERLAVVLGELLEDSAWQTSVTECIASISRVCNTLIDNDLQRKLASILGGACSHASDLAQYALLSITRDGTGLLVQEAQIGIAKELRHPEYLRRRFALSTICKLNEDQPGILGGPVRATLVRALLDPDPSIRKGVQLLLHGLQVINRRATDAIMSRIDTCNSFLESWVNRANNPARAALTEATLKTAIGELVRMAASCAPDAFPPSLVPTPEQLALMKRKISCGVGAGNPPLFQDGYATEQLEFDHQVGEHLAKTSKNKLQTSNPQADMIVMPLGIESPVALSEHVEQIYEVYLIRQIFRRETRENPVLKMDYLGQELTKLGFPEKDRKTVRKRITEVERLFRNHFNSNRSKKPNREFKLFESIRSRGLSIVTSINYRNEDIDRAWEIIKLVGIWIDKLAGHNGTIDNW